MFTVPYRPLPTSDVYMVLTRRLKNKSTGKVKQVKAQVLTSFTGSDIIRTYVATCMMLYIPLPSDKVISLL